MTIRPIRAAAVATVAAALLGAGALPAAAHPYRPAAVVAGHADSLHPEDAVWDAAHHRFLVGSLRHGTVSAVRPDGSVRTLVDDPEHLVSVIGIQIDRARGRVLVANADPGVGLRHDPAKVVAGIGAYDLETGRRLFYTDLAAVAADGGRHFANDLVLGPDGETYVTDSFSPLVYRVRPDGRASVLVRDDRLATPAGAFGLNGIVRLGHTLLIGKYDDGTLWRLALDRTAELRQVALSGPRAVGLDGLLYAGDGTLRGVTNTLGGTGADTLVDLHSADGWRSATLTVRAAADPAPTALVAGPGGTVYELSGRMDLLFKGVTDDRFTLRRV
ncbi:SMP-30/gluconolactonase/LRE family protein [Kitasatospora sp. CMC57]|uniref:SMP-30/gluconolactonase/LRE family protein n=1 Tax=Kitasatospora sp. CMC57 TaxID=3231513 RepID=A0AB33K0B3_9ACTN